MYGDFILLEKDGNDPARVQRLALGDTAGRDEAWLRDSIFKFPELLPIADIDASFESLTPLCTELRTEAGRLDVAFINNHGKLVLVECKLWRNPEARRKVVAQVLDYARVIQKWSYADLQREVSAARGEKGNLPYELVKQKFPDLEEHRFVDQVDKAMKAGRFLLLIAGDGIRQDIDAMAELINRNAASGFSFGLVEVALYGLEDGGIIAQPRVIAKTKTITRTVVLVRDPQTNEICTGGADDEALVQAPEEAAVHVPSPLGESEKQAEYRRWWTPVLEMSFDDPEQEPPQLFYPNNVRIALPWPNMWITLYCMQNGRAGVCTAGKKGADQPAIDILRTSQDEILNELPDGSIFDKLQDSSGNTIRTERRVEEFSNDEEIKNWLMDVANRYVNVLRPRLSRILEEKNRE